MNKKTTENNKRIVLYQIVILTVIVVTGFGLRIINLGGPGFGTDEPLHVFAAQSILENGKPELPSGILYKRALLYTKTVALSFKFFGVSEFSARLPSVIFGTLAIILLFFIGKKFYGTAVGLISAILVAYIPYQIAWSRECRMYTMFQLFYVAGVFAFYYGFEGKEEKKNNHKNTITDNRLYLYFCNLKIDWKWIFISFVLLYISYSLQSLTAIIGPSLFSYSVIMGISLLLLKNLSEFLKSKYTLFITLTALIAILVLAVSSEIVTYIKSYLFFKPFWAERLKINPLYYTKFLTSASLFPLGAFVVLGSIQAVTRKCKVGVFTFIIIVIPVLILTFIPTGTRGDRYIFNILPMIILITSYAITNICQFENNYIINITSKERLYRYRPLLNIFLAMVVLFYTSSPWVYFWYRTLYDYYGEENNLALGHRNWPDASQYVRSTAQIGDLVVTSEPLTVYYYGLYNIHYYIGDDYKREPQFLIGNEKRIYDTQSLKDVLSKHTSGWIVIDAGRFYSNHLVASDLREFIFNNLRYHDVVKDGTVLLFSWNKKS